MNTLNIKRDELNDYESKPIIDILKTKRIVFQISDRIYKAYLSDDFDIKYFIYEINDLKIVGCGLITIEAGIDEDDNPSYYISDLVAETCPKELLGTIIDNKDIVIYDYENFEKEYNK